jgi:hypothetical protein
MAMDDVSDTFILFMGDGERLHHQPSEDSEQDSENVMIDRKPFYYSSFCPEGGDYLRVRICVVRKGSKIRHRLLDSLKS